MMIVTRFFYSSVFVLSMGLVANAKTPVPSQDDKLQAACYDDVQKLCKDEMPDVDKVTVCMKQKKSMVSAQCRAAYKASQS